MKLKAIGVAAIAALALSGVFASGAAAEIVLTPSAQEMAEHPGDLYWSTCQMSEWERRESQFTDQYVNKANAEGKRRGTGNPNTPRCRPASPPPQSRRLLAPTPSSAARPITRIPAPNNPTSAERPPTRG